MWVPHVGDLVAKIPSLSHWIEREQHSGATNCDDFILYRISTLWPLLSKGMDWSSEEIVVLAGVSSHNLLTKE